MRDVPLDDATTAHGGKAATLGRLRRAGLPVPDGFVVPADVPAGKLAGVVGEGLDGLERRRAGPGRPVVEPVEAPLAVRSSAADEDTAGASAAGQYETVLGATGPHGVVAALRTCRDSATGRRATAYRAATGGEGGTPAVAVLVQRMVDARAAGVLFARTDGSAVIEAAWGLGESVVRGAVDPDRLTVAGGRVTGRRTGAQRTRVDRDPTGGTVRRDVTAGYQPCLDDAAALRVAALGTRVADLLGPGAEWDVEWALDHDGALWLLQARPVTAALPRRPECCEREFWGNSESSSPRNRAHNTRGGGALPWRGTAGSGGRARGPVRVVRGPDDFGRVLPGDVLVCRETDPAWTPLFGVVAAVVTETGGLLSHAAIVARELRLPAVLGVPGLLDSADAVPDGAVVAVDGDAGTVRRE